ncbi:1998_t:CDS:2 [Funneliformis geosporum]|nr:1998_t:CDS:2 [Funneliformis geosporum]
MPITKQNSKNPKNLQTTQPYPTNLITNDNKNIEQTASLLQKNKSNSVNTPVTNKRTKISNEVSPLTIENIIDSIILSPSPETEIIPDQIGLNRIMDSLSKLEQKFKTLSDDLIATKNISKELQQGQVNLFMRVENIEQIYHISVPNQQNKPKQPIQFMDLDKPIPIKQS